MYLYSLAAGDARAYFLSLKSVTNKYGTSPRKVAILWERKPSEAGKGERCGL